MNNQEWKYSDPFEDDSLIRSLERHVGFSFPHDFFEFIKKKNGAYPSFKNLRLPNGNEITVNRILRIEADAVDNVNLNFLALRSEHGVSNLVPFANDPFGNLFCFEYINNDFRQVVFWRHEDNLRYDVCKTFSDFLKMLFNNEHE